MQPFYERLRFVNVSTPFHSDSKFHKYKKAPVGERETQRQDSRYHNTDGEEEEEELDLLYDQVLDCYYDPKTNKYYQLVWKYETSIK